MPSFSICRDIVINNTRERLVTIYFEYPDT